jgi:hypothetical protein
MRTTSTPDMYAHYLTYLKGKIFKYSEKLTEISAQKQVIWNKIVKYEKYYNEVGIDLDDLVYSNYHLYNGHRLRTFAFTEPYAKVLRSYIIAYMNLYKLEQYCLNTSKTYESLITSYPFYSYILKNLNDEFNKLILTGCPVDLGFGLGSIKIHEKERDFSNPSCTKAVNWGESKKLKEHLIETGQVPYDSKTAPNGVKWHVPFTERYTYWYWWNIKNMKLPNAFYYKFVPTKFINNRMRDKKQHDELCKDQTAILECKDLGNVDKLAALIKFHPNIIYSYRR